MERKITELEKELTRATDESEPEEIPVRKKKGRITVTLWIEEGAPGHFVYSRSISVLPDYLTIRHNKRP